MTNRDIYPDCELARYTLINHEDQYLIPVFCFKSTNKFSSQLPAIQIIHGMCEHHEYYTEFASYFNKLGYDVYIHDQRGHGQAVTDLKDLGFVAENNGHQKLISDTLVVTNDIYRKTNSPIIVLGHSMGALVALAATCSTKHPQYIRQLVLIGSPGIAPTWQIIAGSLLINFEIWRKSKHYNTPIGKTFLQLFCNLGFRKEKNKFSWVTRDLQWRKKIELDPKAGFIPQSQFWVDLLDLLKYTRNINNLNTLNKNLSIYFYDGADDVINNYTKQTKKLIIKLKTLGFSNIHHIIYPQARHNLFIDTNREEFFADLARI